MMCPLCSGSLPALPGSQRALVLLRQAQDYLRCRAQRQHAGSAARAWHWLYHSHVDQLRRWLLACHVPRDCVEDCLQEVWIVVLRKLPGFVSDGKPERLGSWLRAIAHAKVMDLCRYQSRHAAEHGGLDTESQCVSREPEPAAAAEQRDLQAEVQRVLTVLRTRVSPLTFAAFQRHWLFEQPIAQIAAEFQETPRQITRRLCTAKQKFRLLYEEIVFKS